MQIERRKLRLREIIIKKFYHDVLLQPSLIYLCFVCWGIQFIIKLWARNKDLCYMLMIFLVDLVTTPRAEIKNPF